MIPIDKKSAATKIIKWSHKNLENVRSRNKVKLKEIHASKGNSLLYILKSWSGLTPPTFLGICYTADQFSFNLNK